jgi:hypothetical protein
MARLLGLSALLFVGAAHASPATEEDDARATALFKEARALIEAGSVSEACLKFAESLRLHPGGGTLLNLGICHEREGKAATASAELHDARAIAVRDGRDDRVALADEHLRALEGALSLVVIAVPPSVDVPGLEILVDERVIARTSWGLATPMDPGEHVVEARLPGQLPWRTTLVVLPAGDRKTLVVPPWTDGASTPEPAAPAATSLAPAGADRRSGEKPDRTAALVVGGVGVAALAAGTYFGVRAVGKHQDSQDACTTNPCSQASKDLNGTAKTFADVSTVSFAVGLAGIGVGAFLWLRGSSQGAPRTVRVVPRVGPGLASLGLVSEF